NRVARDFGRLQSYAFMSSDQDTRVTKYLGMKQEVAQLASEFDAKASFVEPEILKMDRSTIDSFLAKEKRLEVYRHYLDDLLRRKPHTLSEGEEKILADAGLVAAAPQTIYGVFSDADFPNPEVTLSDGKKVRLDSSGFSLARTN